MRFRHGGRWRRCRPGAAAASVVSALLALTGAACDVKVGDEGGVSLGVSAGRAEDAWTRSYTLPPSGEFHIVSFNGPVEIGRSDGTELEVRIVREARASSDERARAMLQRVEIVEEAAPARVSITVRPVEDAAPQRRGRAQGVTVRVSARVPAGTALSVSAQNGPIRLDRVTGRLTAAAANAALTATGISGPVNATVVNGGVDLDFASFDGAVELSVVNGAIRLALPEDAGATLAGAITNGRLRVDDPFTVSGTPDATAGFAGQQRLGGAINGGGPLLTIQATNGSVRVVPRTASPDATRGR